MTDMHEHTNRLIHELSPYLQQHAHNPVDWYPWGTEALAKAAAENKPIFLSIGYSACHWCHRLREESFEDEATARLMSEHFISIKVDREERPDLDALYMEAVQQLTGSGGWPMSVFLTPAGAPFAGGTYFPPEPRYQMPSFRQVLLAIAEAWRTRRDEIERQAAELAGALSQPARSGLRKPANFLPQTARVPVATLAQATGALLDRMDPVLGGFGPAPKFPQPMTLDFLLRMQARRASPRGGLDATPDDDRLMRLIRLTLDRMAEGGIYDQLGGGFHRYSTDARWLVPHFEKMLYDNALLSPVYLHAWQLTGEERYRAVVDDVLAYIMREMTGPEGGFYSTQDADSEGEEGIYYLWTPAQLRDILGEEDARLAMSRWGVTEPGNFEGATTLHVAQPEEIAGAGVGLTERATRERLADIRARLLAARAARVPPATDDKVLTAWNAWMLRAFAEAARATGSAEYARMAERNAAFLTGAMMADGTLRRTWRAGQSKPGAYLEDYASLISALISLYELNADGKLVRQARDLAETMISLFWDATTETFFDTARDAESLIGRPRALMDNATPSGTSLACEALLRLSALTGELRFRELAARILVPLAPAMAEHPTAFGHLLCALDDLIGPFDEIALAGTPGSKTLARLRETLASQFLPRSVLAASGANDELVPLLTDRPLRNGKATAYVCEGQVCQAPVTTPKALLTQVR